MSTVNGLPAHVLLVHVLVVLAPLTAVLVILCALWPAARRVLAWPVLALAAFCLVLTPITTEAGEWLEHRVGRSPLVHTHAELGDTMIYVSAALFVAAALLVVVHVRTTRGKALKPVLAGLVSVVALAIGAGAVTQVYRIGDSGAQSAWSDVVSTY
ncbi:DUF2231 domain-containing protein [Mycolicibacterium mageritense]|uniref:DUF2231 domain-containing protein n=1 Tax=Mycolicibacterium mageritense TaxID=53462 RepID=UPI001E4F46F8|nr:DUF2231 domain-containing protein [Mycolicibacterium mageritense]MBN3458583.1 hypothetical protein [Mycobacterium sp. DSM 3803]GJJ18080.1 hypothetical protein MTY414_17530 [Mycolicibacterium mageritense]